MPDSPSAYRALRAGLSLTHSGPNSVVDIVIGVLATTFNITCRFCSGGGPGDWKRLSFWISGPSCDSYFQLFWRNVIRFDQFFLVAPPRRKILQYTSQSFYQNKARSIEIQKGGFIFLNCETNMVLHSPTLRCRTLLLATRHRSVHVTPSSSRLSQGKPIYAVLRTLHMWAPLDIVKPVYTERP